MAVQYSPLPELQLPNVNLLGAYAQGQALRQSQLQEEKLQQYMQLQAEQTQREAEKAQMESQGKQLDNLAKVREQLRQDVLGIKNQQDADRVFAKYAEIAPDILPQDRTFNAENQRTWMMTTSQFLDATKPYEREYIGDDGRPVKGRFYVNPITQQEVMIGGSERAQPPAYTLTKEGMAFDPATGQFKPAVPEAPASRGQAGAFAAPPSAAPAGDTMLGGAPMSAIKQGFARVESGSPQGDYGALGPEVKRKSGVDRAYGKYQVMGANIPSWTKQALGRSLTPDEFLASPEAQEAVFEDQFTRNFKKYGTIEDAASVWFSGRPLAQATKAGARDVNISAPEYVQRVTGGIGNYRTVPTAPMTGERPTLRALTEQPVNAMAPPLPPVNAMAGPVGGQPAFGPAPTPQPTPQTYTEVIKQPLKQKNTQIFGELLGAAEEMESAGILPKLKGEKMIPRAKKIGEALLPSSVQRVIDPEAERLRTRFTNIIDQYVDGLRASGELTAGEANTVKELEAKKAKLGSPDMTIDEIRDIIRSLDKNLGTGSLAKSSGERRVSAEPAQPSAPASRPPLSSFFAR